MVARVALVVAPTGMVTSLLVTVTTPLLAVIAVTIAPEFDSTTFVDVNLSCFAASIALYAPSTYDAAAATDVLSNSPSAKAGETMVNTAKIQNNSLIFQIKGLETLPYHYTKYQQSCPDQKLRFYYYGLAGSAYVAPVMLAVICAVLVVSAPHTVTVGTVPAIVELVIVWVTPVFFA